jgi:hypothetical protein
MRPTCARDISICGTEISLIQQHLFERGDGGGWDAFSRENPDLMKPDLLRQFYSQAQLDSPMARKVFLLPRIAPTECPVH